ncbi:MAG: GDSL-type esterase/lipase family protein [Planctomycetota bacterium]|jgi:beta-glucosidase
MSTPWIAETQDKEWLSEADWLERHCGILQDRDEMGAVDVLFFGDSITQGWCGEGMKEWEEHYAPLKSLNAGIGGDETQHLLWRMEHGLLDGLAPKVCSLLIGTNNIGNAGASAADTVKGIEAVVAELQRRVPEMYILLHLILPRSAPPIDPLRRTVMEANELLRARFTNCAGLTLLDYARLFLDETEHIPAELMPDFLHLSPEGYRLWREQLLPVLKAKLSL